MLIEKPGVNYRLAFLLKSFLTNSLENFIKTGVSTIKKKVLIVKKIRLKLPANIPVPKSKTGFPFN